MNNYSKTEVMDWIEETVRDFFEGRKMESVKSNVKIVFDSEEYEICVRQALNGRWEICRSFFTDTYRGEDWMRNLVDDISDEAMRFIHRPLKKEW